MSKERPNGQHQRPGPDPEHLKIDLPWEEAVKRALRKKRPAEGGSKDAPKKPMEDDAAQ